MNTKVPNISQNYFDQQKRSKYIGFFNMPFFPELYMSFNNYKNLRKIWKVHDETEINAYLSVFRQTGAIRSALNWYRANIGNRRNPSDYIKFGNVEELEWTCKIILVQKTVG